MIGLKRGTVRLYEHEKEWELEAERTIRRLYRILGNVAKDIQHVGSTSIPAVKAKPIIDIAVAVDDFNDVLALEADLKDEGFYYRPNVNLPDQLLFACGSYYDGSGDLQTHFIHVVLTDSMQWFNYINSRDYLNKKPCIAKEYEDLKVAFAAKAPVDSGREQYLKGKHDFIVHTLRKALVDSYFGKKVRVKIDRPIGSVHPKYPNLIYPLNYGYLPNVTGGDGGELDVYLLGVKEPVAEYTATIIGIAHRANDAEDKLVAAPEGMIFDQAQIAEAIDFQERYFKSEIEAIYQKSCGAVVYRKRDGAIEYLCLLQRRSRTYSVPKGHLEAFETEEETAKRELFEEIGIAVDFEPNFRAEMQYDLPNNKHKTVVVFLAECHGELDVNFDEIERYSWCIAKQAKKTLPAWYGEVIDRVEQRLR